MNVENAIAVGAVNDRSEKQIQPGQALKAPGTRVKGLRVKTSVKSGGMQNHNETLVRAGR